MTNTNTDNRPRRRVAGSVRSIALDLLSIRRARGVTLADLTKRTRRGSSVCSSSLSQLVTSGHAIRLDRKRDGCSVYVLPKYAPKRPKRSTSSTRSTTVDLARLATVLDDARRLIEDGSTYPAYALVIDALDMIERGRS